MSDTYSSRPYAPSYLQMWKPRAIFHCQVRHIRKFSGPILIIMSLTKMLEIYTNQ